MTTKDEIIEVVSQFINLDKEAESFLSNHSTLKNYKKGATFLEEGKRNNKMGYLVTGLIRSFYHNDEGEELTTGFYEENSFFTDLESYEAGGNSRRTLEALIDSQVLEIEMKVMNHFRANVFHWITFERDYLMALLSKKIAFQRELTNGSTQHAYLQFLKNYPQAALFAPRYQIASFLGMSPYTLSRMKLPSK